MNRHELLETLKDFYFLVHPELCDTDLEDKVIEYVKKAKQDNLKQEKLQSVDAMDALIHKIGYMSNEDVKKALY